MDTYHVEAWRWLRDHAKPCTQRDAADLREVRTYGGPKEANVARANINRQRNLCLRPFKERPRPIPQTAKSIAARVRNDFLKEQMALLGGTRTIAPAYPDVYIRPQVAWRTVPADRAVELYPEPKPFEFMTEERACSIARDHLIAMAKAGLEVDMWRVLRVFDDFAQFGEAVRNALR